MYCLQFFVGQKYSNTKVFFTNCISLIKIDKNITILHVIWYFKILVLDMGRGKNVPIEIRRRIIEFYRTGRKQADIARCLLIHRSIVSRTIKNFNTRGSIVPLKNPGRPRKTTKKMDRRIIRLSMDNPFMSSTKILSEIKETGECHVSTRTIRRRLVDNNLFSRRPAKKPLLSKKNIRARLEFAATHAEWSTEKWKNVLFSDESKFNLFRSDGVCHVRRPKDERLNPKYVCPTVKHGGGSVMVWGCFSSHGMGPLHRIEGIMDKFVYKNILENVMEPYAEEFMPITYEFQQDNDPKHTSKLVKKWFRDNQIKVMVWPAQSPDLNPIENLWQIVDQKIRDKNYSNLDELFEALNSVWQNIPQETITRLIESMPNRCRDVLKAKGHWTKY